MKMKIEEASSDQAKLESIFDMGNMGLSDLSNAEKDEDEEAEMQEVVFFKKYVTQLDNCICLYVSCDMKLKTLLILGTP